MGFFRGQLNRDRPFKGVQCVLYTLEGEKLDIDVTDDGGYYGFEGIPDGTYQVRFYGRNYTQDDWITIVILDGVSPNSNYIRIILDEQPNKDGWHNEILGWNLQYDAEKFDAYFKIWAPKYVLAAGDPPLENPEESPEIQDVTITSNTDSLDVSYDLTETPTELYYSVEPGQGEYDPNNLGTQTEPAAWTAWDGIARQIEITGRWVIQAKVVDKRTGDDVGFAEERINIDFTYPVWDNPELASVETGAGGLRVTWDKNNPTTSFGSSVRSYSGNHMIQVRGSFSNDYNASFVLGEFPEGQKYFQYVSLVEQWLYVFISIVNEADNRSENIADMGGIHHLYSMTPSNLDDELTIIYEDEADYNPLYYQVIYGLNNRTNTIQVLTTSNVDITEVQYIKHNPDYEPAGDETGGNIGEFRNWQDVEDLRIDDAATTPPFTTTSGGMHILKFKKVQTKGIRVKFSAAANSVLAAYDPVTGVKGFNVVESLAAETFVGQTFEFQRNIRFLSDLGNERMVFDKFGLTGFKDITQYSGLVDPDIPGTGDTFPAPTFYLGLNGEFFVGHKNYPGVDDAYIHFNPQTERFEINAVVTIKPGSSGWADFEDYIPPEDLIWDNIESKPNRFDIGVYYPEPVPPDTDASGLYLSGDFIGFYKQTSEIPDFWTDYDGTVNPPGYWPVFIRNDGSFAFTSGNDKGLRYLTGDDSVLIDVNRFKLKGYVQGEGGLEIDSAEKHFVNLTGSDVDGVDWNFKIKADETLAGFETEPLNTIPNSSIIVTTTHTVNFTQQLIKFGRADAGWTEFGPEINTTGLSDGYTTYMTYNIVYYNTVFGDVVLQGKKYANSNWETLQATNVNQGDPVITTTKVEFMADLTNVSSLRFGVSGFSGSGFVEITDVNNNSISPSLGQYYPKVLINKLGFFTKVAPDRIVPLASATTTSGGGGGSVDLTGYLTAEQLAESSTSNDYVHWSNIFGQPVFDNYFDWKLNVGAEEYSIQKQRGIKLTGGTDIAIEIEDPLVDGVTNPYNFIIRSTAQINDTHLTSIAWTRESTNTELDPLDDLTNEDFLRFSFNLSGIQADIDFDIIDKLNTKYVDQLSLAGYTSKAELIDGTSNLNIHWDNVSNPPLDNYQYWRTQTANGNIDVEENNIINFIGGNLISISDNIASAPEGTPASPYELTIDFTGQINDTHLTSIAWTRESTNTELDPLDDLTNEDFLRFSFNLSGIQADIDFDIIDKLNTKYVDQLSLAGYTSKAELIDGTSNLNIHWDNVSNPPLDNYVDWKLINGGATFSIQQQKYVEIEGGSGITVTNNSGSIPTGGSTDPYKITINASGSAINNYYLSAVDWVTSSPTNTPYATPRIKYGVSGSSDVEFDIYGGQNGLHTQLDLRYIQPGDNISLLTNDSAYLTSIPTSYIQSGDNISLLTNDSAYLTSIPTSYIQSGDNISLLTNDSGYITDYTVTETDVKTHQGALTITKSQISDFGSYDNYVDWKLINGGATFSIQQQKYVEIEGGSGITVTNNSGSIPTGGSTDPYKITINASGSAINNYYLSAVDWVTSSPTNTPYATPRIKYGVSGSSDVEFDIYGGQNGLHTQLDLRYIQPGDNISLLTNDSAYLTSIPTSYIQSGDNISLLTNDSAYLTSIPTSYIQSGDNISLLTNDSGYITDYTVTETDVKTHQGALTITKSQISDFGSYDNYVDWKLINGGATFSIQQQKYVEIEGGSGITVTNNSGSIPTGGSTDPYKITINASGSAINNYYLSAVDWVTSSPTNTPYATPRIKYGVSGSSDVEFDIYGGQNGLHTQLDLRYIQPGDNISLLTNDSGYITDYTVTQADVTQHQGALNITESQISDFGTYDNYDGWDLYVGTNLQGRISSGENLSFVGTGATTVSHSSGTITIDSTDTNTWRSITSSPTNGQTTVSISSDWAHDHESSSTAHPRDTRNQIAGTYNTQIGTDDDINTSGALIIDRLYFTDGVCTSHGTRTLSASDIGAATSNNYVDGLSFSNGTLTASVKDATNRSANLTDFGSATISANNFSLASDRRLKTDISDVKSALNIVHKLLPKRYKKTNEEEIGFVTDEIPKELDFLVNRENEYESLKYINLIALLTKAIQELDKKIEEK